MGGRTVSNCESVRPGKVWTSALARPLGERTGPRAMAQWLTFFMVSTILSKAWPVVLDTTMVKFFSSGRFMAWKRPEP